MKIKNKELSATQNLLELIRGKPLRPLAADRSENDIPNSIKAECQAPHRFSSNLINYRKKTDVGIWLDDRFICAVAIIDGGRDKKIISQWWIENFHYSNGIEQEIPLSISERLKRICNKPVSKIWLTALFEKLDVCFLLLPKITDKHIDNAALAAFMKKDKSFINDYDKKQTIFDFHLISPAVAPVKDKLNVVAYTSPREDITKRQNDFFRAGVPLSGISSLSFSVQNLIRSGLLSSPQKHICTLFIGMEYSTVDIFFPDGGLGISRRFKTSVKSMMRAVETPVFEDGDDEKREKIFWKKIQDNTFFQGPLGYALKEVLDRLIWRVERTVDYFFENIGPVNIAQIFILGKTADCPAIITYLDDRMEASVDVLNMTQLPSSVCFDQKAEKPSGNFEQSLVALGVGAALSSPGKTSNLLMPREERSHQDKIRKIKKSLLAVFFIALCFSFFHYYRQLSHIRQKTAVIDRLSDSYEKMIETDGLYVTPQHIENQMSTMAATCTQLRPVVSRWLSDTIISEITLSLPEGMHLLNFKLLFKKGLKKNTGLKQKGYQVEIEGIAYGGPLTQEKRVVEYMESLEKKELFPKVEIIKKSRGVFQKSEVLRFVLNCESADG